MSIRFDDQVAIVTGSGGGLGRCHALGLAARGAKVVINDFGGAVDGSGGSSDAALAVVAEIEAAGGTAMADGADVSDYDQVTAMVTKVMDAWGRIDVLINNAGILRDRSFNNMEIADFQKVVDVHLMGSVNCTKAVWGIMREQNYGRIVMTTSATGLYGNFGQANYGAAKLGLAGFTNSLAIEGRKNNIFVNTLAPVALTRMTEDIIPPEFHNLLKPENVTPGVIFLASDKAPTGNILSAGAGSFARAAIQESEGMFLGDGASADDVAENWTQISDLSSLRQLNNAADQTQKFLAQAAVVLKERG
jgi:NAD(P)-dependent dehydrogenase (short-subunit alcohol dehydrogenase family)